MTKSAHLSPTADCRAIADILPLLDEPDVDAHQAAQARAHLATCAYCQEQRAAYRRLEAAALRYLGPPATPRYRTEEIMGDLLMEPAAASVDAKTSPAGVRRAAPFGPHRPRRLLSGLASLAAVLVIALLAGALFASRAQLVNRPVQPAVQPTPQIAQLGPYSHLFDISMVSPTEGWAVGEASSCVKPSDPHPCVTGYPLMLHYKNGRWSRVAVPFTKTTARNDVLNEIEMLSATDGWASSTQGRLLHYDGNAWKLVAGPPQTNLLYFRFFSDTDGWAIGSGTERPTANIMHYNGKTWTAQPLPAGLGLGPSTYQVESTLAMISPTEGWATYTVFQEPQSTPKPQWPSKASILHYANGVWTVQKSIPGNAVLESISMTSATDGWAVGLLDAASDSPPALLFHYTQGRWVQVDNNLPSAGWVSVVSATDGWMTVGDLQTLAHYNGSQWVPVAFSPAVKRALGDYVISRLYMTSTTEGWAVGRANYREVNPPTLNRPGEEGANALILHFHNGVWSIVNS